MVVHQHSAELGLVLCPPRRQLPLKRATILVPNIDRWATTGFPLSTFNFTSESTRSILETAKEMETAHIPFLWYSAPAQVQSTPTAHFNISSPGYTWPANPTVLALVPHWGCELWLARCLRSLVQQKHPLTNIVVIDDDSTVSPEEIVSQFPRVTLLAAPHRVGPYHLIQQVIADTQYTAYMFQDADDWSTCDRLTHILSWAKATRAELIGTQEIRILSEPQKLQGVGYPENVNQALAQRPGHALLHPTSVVTKHLLTKVGGFASGLKFSGDTEFLFRAHLVARVSNVPRYCYFRRKRPHSLTTSPDTGLDSVPRQKLLARIKRKAFANLQAMGQGEPPDLEPLECAPPISLTHLCGPKLMG